MNPELEKLYAEQERVQKELEQTKHQQQRLRNRISYLTKTGEMSANSESCSCVNPRFWRIALSRFPISL